MISSHGLFVRSINVKPLEHPELMALPLLGGIKEGRYFLYRRT
ncbi:class I SAM-dependent methyltransferase [Rhizobium leguminosarum]